MPSDPRTFSSYRAIRDAFRARCEAEDARCWMCGRRIDYTGMPGPDSFEVDHYYPVSTHPEHVNDPANLKPSHKRCNAGRGDGPPLPGLGTLSRDWRR